MTEKPEKRNLGFRDTTGVLTTARPFDEKVIVGVIVGEIVGNV
jgi:hypothetical protein